MLACPMEGPRILGVRFGSPQYGVGAVGKLVVANAHTSQPSNLDRPQQTRSNILLSVLTDTRADRLLFCQIVSNPEDTSATTPAAPAGWYLSYSVVVLHSLG